MEKNKKSTSHNPIKNKILRRLGELISDGLLTLVKWNFLFLLTSLPVITIGPSLAALHCCTNALAKDDRPQFKAGRLYFSAFRASFRQAFPLGLLTLFICIVFGGGFLLYLSMISENILFIPLTSVSALVLLLFWGIMIHALPMMFDFDQMDWESQQPVTTDQSLFSLLREAAGHALTRMKPTIIALVFSLIFLGGQVMMFPAVLPLTAAIGFSFPAIAAGLAHTEPDI